MNDAEKKCLHCARLNNNQAKVCRFCGRSMPGADQLAGVASKAMKIAAGVFIGIPLLFIVGLVIFGFLKGVLQGLR